jgi:hypothetical protein
MLIVVETFLNPGEPSASPVRVRPLDGQFKEEYRVWCSEALRLVWPPNSLFRVSVTRVDRRNSKSFLRIALNEPWEPIDRPEAKRFIAQQFGSFGA